MSMAALPGTRRRVCGGVLEEEEEEGWDRGSSISMVARSEMDMGVGHLFGRG